MLDIPGMWPNGPFNVKLTFFTFHSYNNVLLVANAIYYVLLMEYSVRSLDAIVI